MERTYKYGDEEFKVTEPKDCVMEISSKGLTVQIKIHTTNKYWDYFKAENYGYFHSTVGAAVTSACKRILAYDAKGKDKLGKGLNDFFDKLDGN